MLFDARYVLINDAATMWRGKPSQVLSLHRAAQQCVWFAVQIVQEQLGWSKASRIKAQDAIARHDWPVEVKKPMLGMINVGPINLWRWIYDPIGQLPHDQTYVRWG